MDSLLSIVDLGITSLKFGYLETPFAMPLIFGVREPDGVRRTPFACNIDPWQHLID
jgi:hypothetical protein